MYKRILVPIDGSENSKLSLKHASKLAEYTGARLTIFHVLDLPPQLKSLKSYHLVKEQLREEGEKIIREAKEICASYKAAFDEKIVTGIPADEVIQEEKRGNHDLIVIGNRGMGEVKGWILGSVSRRVVRYARCPVLVVK